MFWRNENRPPRDLTECAAPDDVAEDLQLWASRIFSAAAIVAAIIVALGVIMTFSAVKEMEDVSEDAVFIVGFTTAVTWLAYAAAAFISCRLLSLLIEAAATVTQNTAVCAKTALYQASKEEQVAAEVPHKTKTTEGASTQRSTIFDEDSVPYYCERCGKYGPYEGNCPRCGSDQKHYN